VSFRKFINEVSCKYGTRFRPIITLAELADYEKNNPDGPKPRVILAEADLVEFKKQHPDAVKPIVEIGMGIAEFSGLVRNENARVSIGLPPEIFGR
jgi:hypothetical protein